MMTALNRRSWWTWVGLLGLWAALAPLQAPARALMDEGVRFEVKANFRTASNPFVSLASGVVGGGCPLGAPDWTFNPSDFESTMTVTAAVFAEAQRSIGTDDLLAAFVGGAVQGVATPVDVNGPKTFFLTVYGNAGSGQAVTFQYYEAATQLVYSVGEELMFEANAHHGLVSAPLVLTASCATETSVEEASDVPEAALEVVAYPNPFRDRLDVELTGYLGEAVRVSVYDALGRRVEVLSDGLTAGRQRFSVEGGSWAPGLYLVVVQTAQGMVALPVVRTP